MVLLFMVLTPIVFAGILTQKQVCQPNPCNISIIPLNGTYDTICSTYDSIPSGSACALTCDYGYTLNNGLPYSCLAGIFNGNQVCLPSPCTIITPSNGNLNNCSSTLSSGSSCMIECAIGYNIIGSITTCLLGVVTQSQSCSIVTCPTYTLPQNGASSSCNGGVATSYGTICTLSCLTGYTPSGSSTCQSNGTYNAQTCDIVTCASFSLPSNSISSNCSSSVSPITYNSICFLTCSLGYTPSIPPSLCQSDSTYTPSSCIINTCPPYMIPPNTFSSNCINNNIYSYGQVCNINCINGYYPINNNILCQANSTWSSIQLCSIVTCPTYSLPSQGVASNCSIGATTTYASACRLTMFNWSYN